MCKVFAGNTDKNTVVSHELNPPIRDRYIRFRPLTWNGHISMRVELYGCTQGNEGVFLFCVFVLLTISILIQEHSPKACLLYYLTDKVFCVLCFLCF